MEISDVKKRHLVCVALGLLLILATDAKVHAQEVLGDSTKTGRNGVVIKVISGGPCGLEEPLVYTRQDIPQNSLHLDLACSCLLLNWDVSRKEDIPQP